jgi:hypothetical protein
VPIVRRGQTLSLLWRIDHQDVHNKTKMQGWPRVRRRFWLVVVVYVAALGASSGCVHVRPHQRERLAHPTMTSGDWGGPGEAHARSVREGAVGGGAAGEAGCGCN